MSPHTATAEPAAAAAAAAAVDDCCVVAAVDHGEEGLLPVRWGFAENPCNGARLIPAVPRHMLALSPGTSLPCGDPFGVGAAAETADKVAILFRR